MLNFDVIQSLARTALGGSNDAVVQQIERLAARLTEAGDEREARSLRALVTRSQKRQAVEPVDLIQSAADAPEHGLQKLGPRAALPVDKDSGAPLCEVVFPDKRWAFPILPNTARASYESLVDEWRNQDLLRSAGLPISRSLLIYGPPGTGKTTLAMRIASQLDRPAIVVRLDGLISSLLGNTARNLGALFDFCNRYDCVLVLDEFDAVAKIRDDSNEIGEIKRVVNALLQNLDKRVPVGLTIAITNHEQLLDSAIWRRFEHQIYLGMPSYEIRLSISRSQLAHLSDANPLAKTIAWITDGRSGADVKTLSVACMKTWVLADDEPISQIKALRSAVNSTGTRTGATLSDALEVPDSTLAALLHDSPAQLGPGELASIFDRDRRTVSRWLQVSANDRG